MYDKLNNISSKSVEMKTGKSWDEWVSFLQISLFCPRNRKDKTNFRFHQEKLKDKETRVEMRKHWQKTLSSLGKKLASGN